MKLCFRTRGGPIQGWGNIYRLASFATYCRTHLAAELVFLVEGPPEVNRFLQERGFEY